MSRLDDAKQCRLPIDAYHAEIVQKADESDVLIVTGDTGSGKSTRVPRALLETRHAQSSASKFLVATQPRRVAAQTLAKRVGQDLGIERVGHAIGSERAFDEERIDVLFATCGWLVTKLVHNYRWALDKISFLVIDEAHEREVDMDLLCMLCRLLLQSARGKIKVVLMSATLDVDVFDDYFGAFRIERVDVQMRRFPVDIFYAPTLRESKPGIVCNEAHALLHKADQEWRAEKRETLLVRAGALVCRQLAQSAQKPTTMLVFLSGYSAIDEFYEALEQHSSEVQQRYDIHVLHSSVEQESQLDVFEAVAEQKEPLLRIVLATNIAESSVTIPNVEWVIDLGLHKVLRYDEANKMSHLSLENISRASADQRAGRTGRVCRGTVLRFYSVFNYQFDMRAHSEPEICLIALERVLLRFYALKKSSSLDALQRPLECLRNLAVPPDSWSVEQAQQTLLDQSALRVTHRESTSIDVSEYEEIGKKYEQALIECDERADVLRTQAKEWREKKQNVEERIELLEGAHKASAGGSDDQKKSFADIMREQEAEERAQRKNAKLVQSARRELHSVVDRLQSFEWKLQAIDTQKSDILDRKERERTECERRERAEQRDAQSSGKDIEITEFGALLMQLPLSFEHAKFVLYGAQFGVLLPAFVVMGAYLSVPGGVFITPYNKDTDRVRYIEQTRRMVTGRRRYCVPFASDLVGAVALFRDFVLLKRRSRDYGQFFYQNGLQKKRMMQFYRTALSLFNRLAKAGFRGAINALDYLQKHVLDDTSLHLLFNVQERRGDLLRLVIALALEENLMRHDTNFENRRNQWPESVGATQISFDVSVEWSDIPTMRSGQMHTDPRIWLRKVIETNLFTISSDKPFVCQLRNDAADKTLLFYVSCTPEDMGDAVHLLRQLALQSQVLVPLLLRKQKKDTARTKFATLSNVGGARVIDWMHARQFAYDFPPRSALHNLLDTSGRAEEQPRLPTHISHKDLPESTDALAVATDFTLTGRTLRAPMLSLITQNILAPFLLLRGGPKTPNKIFSHALEPDSDCWHSVMIDNERYAHRCSLREKVRIESLAERCEDLARWLHTWTQDSLADDKRWPLLWAFLQKVL